MSPIVLLAVFVVELLSLYYFSRQFTKELSRLLCHITRSHRGGIHLMAFLFLPGTLIHELAHAISAGVLMVDVGELELKPEIQENGVKLGSVEIAQTDPIRRALIGVAPVIIGVLILVGSLIGLQYLFEIGRTFPWWAMGLYLYLLFIIGNTMFSSRKDLEGAVGILLTAVIFIVGCYFFAINRWPGVENSIFTPPVQSIITQSCFSLAVLILADLMIANLIRFGIRK